MGGFWAAAGGVGRGGWARSSVIENRTRRNTPFLGKFSLRAFKDFKFNDPPLNFGNSQWHTGTGDGLIWIIRTGPIRERIEMALSIY